MAEGIKIRITAVPISGSPILVPDIKDVTDLASYDTPGPLYIPVPGYADVAYTSRVTTSLENGSLKALLDLGLVTVDFLLSARFISAVGGGGGGLYIADETPSGFVNSSNTVFTILAAPTVFVGLYYNGQKLVRGGEDYSITGNTITMTFAPDPGDVLRADYMI